MVKEATDVIDMHNRITASQLEKVLRMQLKTLVEHPELTHVLPPLMVWGAPGLGKSSIIKGIADEMGIKFIDVRLAQREPVDVRGLPVPDRENKKVDWMVSGPAFQIWVILTQDVFVLLATEVLTGVFVVLLHKLRAEFHHLFHGEVAGEGTVFVAIDAVFFVLAAVGVRAEDFRGKRHAAALTKFSFHSMNCF